ncbi:pentapeptide repeat-containing protein [Rothia aeria]|uniref:pentapeptide repeat-containing protein n=1 Tax=Rothia aeria TaxID=172042 RepID=UPI0028E465F0|nr:pentapeptide repeat-containing protein [Rothia aeria]
MSEAHGKSMGEAKRLRRLKSGLGRLNGVVPAGGGPAPSVASRLNTVDELAALADEWLADTSVVEQERNRRAQSVITALCDYLRSPANDCDTAPADAAHLSAAGRIRTHILDTIRQHVRWRENPHPAEPMHAELSTEEGTHPLAAELNQPPKPETVLPGPWSHLAFNFSNAVFYDAVDLGEAYWAGPVTFDGATFTHDAYFCNSLYGEDAVFSRCEYRGYVLFSNSTYCGAASFAESTYHNIVYFSGSVYEGCAVFTDSNYRAAADYGCSTYNAGADFSGCTHHGTVTYHMSAYRGETNFTNSLYESHVHAANSTYNAQVLATGCLYRGRADFSGNSFAEGANFSTAAYDNGITLTGSTFAGPAVFASCRFMGDADFTDCTCTTSADFSGTVYWDNAHFDRTVFATAPVFTRARFTPDAAMTSVEALSAGVPLIAGEGELPPGARRLTDWRDVEHGRT